MLQDPISLGLVEAHDIIGTGFTSQVSSQLCSNCCLTDTAVQGERREGGGGGGDKLKQPDGPTKPESV